MEFTIYRGSWRRGGGWYDDRHGTTHLLNSQNRMCCLGQVCHQAGMPLALLLGMGSPLALVSYRHAPLYWPLLVEIGLLTSYCTHDMDIFPEYMFSGLQTEFASVAIMINDINELEDREREAQIEAHFAAQGHTVKFVDGVAPWFQPVEEPVIEVEDEELVCV